VLWVLL